MGYAVAAIGDVDGNGVADFAVTAQRYQIKKGALFIAFLSTSTYTMTLTKASSSPFGGITKIGSALASMGDLNGDGLPELIITASNSTAGNVFLLSPTDYLYSSYSATYMISSRTAYWAQNAIQDLDFDKNGVKVSRTPSQ